MSNNNANPPIAKRPAIFFAELLATVRRFDGVRLRGFIAYVLVLVAIYFRPLLEFAGEAVRNSLYSHAFLIPVVSLYLVMLRAPLLPTRFRTAWGPTFLFIALGASILLFYDWRVAAGWQAQRIDSMACSMASLLAFVTAGAFFFFGSALLRAITFPWAFLVFVVPFPTSVENGIETFFQLASAETAYAMMKLFGLPVLRDGLVFVLPNITIRVAQECSGIRSSLVLFILSLVAGQLYLRSPWKRALLTLLVIPLGMLRNGFRILTISWLCVHFDPGFIDSPIHHRGGPLFFLLSLIPFFGFFYWLIRMERKRSVATP